MDVKLLAQMIRDSNNIVFFGGAGVSTASGIKDFRSDDGLYATKFRNMHPEQILSKEILYGNPELFFDYYRANFLQTDIQPNSAHYFLAKLEKLGKLKAVITQNIDNLHQLAGSKNVLELHGSVYRNYTIHSHKRYDGIEIMLNSKGVPMIDGEMLRPDVTMYCEPLNQEVVSKAINAIANADLLIVGGTSLTVYPAANFITYFRGDKLVGINRDNLNLKYFIQGNIAEIFAELSKMF